MLLRSVSDRRLQLLLYLAADVLGEAVAEVAHGLAVQGAPYDAVVQGEGLRGSGPDVAADTDVHETQGGHDAESEGGVQPCTRYLEWVRGEQQTAILEHFCCYVIATLQIYAQNLKKCA